MENEINFVPSMDDLVFENRNKEYVAYAIRKKYNRTVLWAILVGIIVLSSAVVTPYILASVNSKKRVREEKVVQATMEKLDQPIDAPPPPPPPPPPAEAQAQVKFVAPVVVDSIKVKGPSMATGDEAKNIIKDENVNVKPVAPPVEVEAPKKEEQVFYVVEESPTFQGGDISGFRNFIQKSLVYPEVAQENGIQGKVYISFIVESSGKVSNVKVLRGVDPALDKEAVRAIEASPLWSPGKQRGKAVRVSFTIPIVFQLQ